MTNKEAIEELKARKEHYEMGDGCEFLVEALEKGIEALENQKTGHWIDYGMKYDVRCSICNTQYPLKPISSSRLLGCKSNYCPCCGAKMEGE